MRSRGSSLVELMVGVALALFILSGLIAVFVGGVNGARRMLVEARLQQDLRAAMELITRDLRRGGYWGNAISRTVVPTGVIAPISYADPCTTTPGAAFNPYGCITTSGATEIDYLYSRDALEDNEVDKSGAAGREGEQFRLQFDTATAGLQMYRKRADGAYHWEAVTDTDAMALLTAPCPALTLDTSAAAGAPCSAGLWITANVLTQALDPSDCPTGAVTAPQVQIRTYRIVLTGISRADSAVTHTLVSTVRVRNDTVTGVCKP
ncbi:MAG: hypothetical protein PHI55_04270 [Burkholderiaceae bacterium]|nr:hypothetical protein [Burkholderiaceae bacterium]